MNDLAVGSVLLLSKKLHLKRSALPWLRGSNQRNNPGRVDVLSTCPSSELWLPSSALPVTFTRVTTPGLASQDSGLDRGIVPVAPTSSLTYTSIPGENLCFYNHT